MMPGISADASIPSSQREAEQRSAAAALQHGMFKSCSTGRLHTITLPGACPPTLVKMGKCLGHHLLLTLVLPWQINSLLDPPLPTTTIQPVKRLEAYSSPGAPWLPPEVPALGKGLQACRQKEK